MKKEEFFKCLAFVGVVSLVIFLLIKVNEETGNLLDIISEPDDFSDMEI